MPLDTRMMHDHHGPGLARRRSAHYLQRHGFEGALRHGPAASG